MKISAVGLDVLIWEVPGKGLPHMYQLFQEVPSRDLKRPEGRVDLLVGLD